MIGATAHDARSERGKLVARRDGVGLTGQFPAAKAGREVAEVPRRRTKVPLATIANAAMRHLVGPHVFLEILRRVERRTSFQQRYGYAEIGQYFGDGPASGARSNDDDVVDR